MKNKREGACLSAAYDEIQGGFKDYSQRGEVLVVHGWVYSHKLNASIKHAWLEFTKTGVVYEPVNQVALDKHWQEFYKLRPVKKYNYWQLMKHSLSTGFKGGKFEF